MPVRGGGFIQGCNAQNLISEDKLVIATELTQDTTDTAWFEPTLPSQAAHFHDHEDFSADTTEKSS
jgi:hypothetical protein